MNRSMNFIKFNNMFFFRNYFFNYTRKKINDNKLKLNLKEKHFAKPINQDNLGYPSKLANYFNHIKKQIKNK
jgi:hypothetical protein